jgi:lauroyl/myristoyl acyltransferase
MEDHIARLGIPGERSQMSKPERSHTEHFFYRLLYTTEIFSLVSRISGALGRDGCVAVAKALALGYVKTHPEIVEVVRRNLALVQSTEPSRQEARETFLNFAMGLADYFAFAPMSLREVCSFCDERSGLEHLRTVADEGRGAILATGHFGFFEYGAALLAELGYPSTVLTFPEPSKDFTEWRARYRARWGSETIEIGSDAFSSLAVVQELRKGRFCAMLVDRPFGGPSIPVSSAGGTIAFSLSPGILAHLAQCPVIPVVVRRKPGGNYFLHAGEPIRVKPEISRQDAIRDVASRTGAALVQQFEASPTSWFHFVRVDPGNIETSSLDKKS